MKKILFAAVASAGLVAAVPAFAGGVGVHVGPVGVGVGPGYDHPHHYYRDRDYDGGCRVTRERIETPSGRVIYRTHRVCG